MKTLDNMSIIAETRQQLRLEEACRERLANIALSDSPKLTSLLLTYLFRHNHKRSTESGEQPTSIRRIFRPITSR